MFDVAIIGSGVVGAMISRELSKFNLSICILEKENDVCMGSSKANSAIVHAGFDAKEGSLKALLNVKGSEMMEKVTTELGVPYKRNGSLVLAFNEEERQLIKSLLDRGIKNGVKNLKIVEKDELKELEPNVSEIAVCALYAPTGGIVCPYELTVAAIGNAMDNGAELKLNFEVISISKNENHFTVYSDNDKIDAKFVINAAGINSDKIANLVGDNSFTVHPRSGEYILLDKECGNMVKHTVFVAPGKMGKGILVSPTVDNNVLLGPTSTDIFDKDDKDVTDIGLEAVKNGANKSIKGLPINMAITSFCGLRAVGSTGDFIINSPVKGFINVAGIESPGLSAAPAISVYVREMVEKEMMLTRKESYVSTRKPMHYFRNSSTKEKNEIIKKDKSFGKIVCRCEKVTEGEILEALRRNPKARDLDGVKRRTRAQMGRCQGGFCSATIMELISKELNIPFEKVSKNGEKSEIVVGKKGNF